MSANELVALPAALDGLASLRKLCVGRNRLTQLPEGSAALYRLVSIEIEVDRSKRSFGVVVNDEGEVAAMRSDSMCLYDAKGEPAVQRGDRILEINHVVMDGEAMNPYQFMRTTRLAF